MAKKPVAKDKEAEAAPADGDAAAKGKKKKLMIIAAAGLVVLLGAGGAGAYFMGFIGGKGPTGKEPTDAHGNPISAETANKHAVFLDLPEMTVNLSTVDQRATYLRIKIALEISEKGAADLIQPVLPRVLDAFQVYLRELRTADLEGSAGLFRVKEELQRRVNIAIHPAKVDAVLFKEILIQ